MRSLSLGTVYPDWTSIGALCTFLLGVFAMSKPLTLTRILAVRLSVAGIVFIKLAAPG